MVPNLSVSRLAPFCERLGEVGYDPPAFARYSFNHEFELGLVELNVLHKVVRLGQ
jgi:hypothetical protein